MDLVEERESASGVRAKRSGEAPLPGAAIIADRVCCGGTDRRSGLAAAGPLSLEIRECEFAALVGPAGCGSSTLLRMIAGLVPASSGDIRVHGAAVRRPLDKIGLVFSKPLLLGWRSVLGNVLLAAELRRMDARAYGARARRLLAAVGLAEAADAQVRTLGPADRMRTALCRALLHEPALLVMDDPFAPLDALAAEDLAADIQRLWLARPLTAVLATSRIAEAVFLSDRVFVMSPAPCRILQVISIDLHRPRRLDELTAPGHAEYCARIRTLFRAHGVLS